MILAAFPVGAQMRTRGLLGLSPAVLKIFSATAVKALMVALFPTPAPVIINYHQKYENKEMFIKFYLHEQLFDMV